MNNMHNSQSNSNININELKRRYCQYKPQMRRVADEFNYSMNSKRRIDSSLFSWKHQPTDRNGEEVNDSYENESNEKALILYEDPLKIINDTFMTKQNNCSVPMNTEIFMELC
ncbi:hypothetical protein EDI_338420 [Entamoeba dispar SAW760]|uniref:Uncharacterized protein n=1 Tax=Entamoeba dispar (strain ATCC PRA-260 / SAW760) TaxID=370354 RepID=B0EBH8_ENTDS|nr:uncharacterized protein EDI_338420 [Entamoeba dispar SAW760]EDR28120.1 hypothetical protein EDI_338420 [Entamoeba dispar SAW760]|eukprot:EDR28120.1 hypothetical protein EDI_338420 [Entamoeba dispar SAW760]